MEKTDLKDSLPAVAEAVSKMLCTLASTLRTQIKKTNNTKKQSSLITNPHCFTQI